jgi:hypothetical protein
LPLPGILIDGKPLSGQVISAEAEMTDARGPERHSSDVPEGLWKRRLAGAGIPTAWFPKENWALSRLAAPVSQRETGT